MINLRPLSPIPVPEKIDEKGRIEFTIQIECVDSCVLFEKFSEKISLICAEVTTVNSEV